MVKEGVSNAITHHLSDPRIEGFVSVTRVEMTTDLRNANIFVSIFGGGEAAQNKTFAAITHAKSRIQSLVAGTLQSKFCPVLHFYRDEKFKRALDMMRLIDQATGKLEKENPEEDSDNEEV